MKYSDIDPRKSAFLFELDNVLYPEKDYYFQVYYLFAGMLEYIELVDAKAATDLMVNTYLEKGKEEVFDTVKVKYQLKEAYRGNFNHLLVTFFSLKDNNENRFAHTQCCTFVFYFYMFSSMMVQI